jgi:hypothetical protein
VKEAAGAAGGGAGDGAAASSAQGGAEGPGSEDLADRLAAKEDGAGTARVLEPAAGGESVGGATFTAGAAGEAELAVS